MGDRLKSIKSKTDDAKTNLAIRYLGRQQARQIRKATRRKLGTHEYMRRVVVKNTKGDRE
jgi:hypothetical protein